MENVFLILYVGKFGVDAAEKEPQKRPITDRLQDFDVTRNRFEI
jgi:hypothetical protein